MRRPGWFQKQRVFSTVPTLNVEGSLLRNGLQSEMAHVYVLANTSDTGDFRLGPVADYIVMLALSQASAFGECRPLPSITNRFVAGGARRSSPSPSPIPISPFCGGFATWTPAPIFR